MAKITLSIGPTFLDTANDIYHKASVAIEFDENEKSVEDVLKELKETYKELIKLETIVVKSYRKKKIKRKVRKTINQ